MNKSKLKIFIIIAVLLVLSVIIALYMTKDNQQNQTPLTIDEFKSTMKSYGYDVTGPIEYSEDESECDAYNEYRSIEFKFLKYSDEVGAKKTFDFSKKLWKNVAGKIEINKSFKCAITKDDNTYLIVSRIGDTVLMASTNAQYKETVIEIFNSLGY